MVSIHLPFIWLIILDQGFSTGVLQEFVEHAVPDYLCRGTDLFFLRLSNKKKIHEVVFALIVLFHDSKDLGAKTTTDKLKFMFYK